MSALTGNLTSEAATTSASVVEVISTRPALPAETSLNPVLSGWRGYMYDAVSFPVVLTLILVTTVFALCRDGIRDPDIWWHLHNADFLVAQHGLPRSDHYSFTVAGVPWINHEWLAELPYYFAWRALGLSGINAVMFATLVLIFFGVLYLAHQESKHYKASILAVCLTLFLGSVSFGPRTILFGYLHLVLLLILLQRFRQKGGASRWLIPLLFCSWVNTHGSWLIGMVIFSMVIAAGLVHGQWGIIASEPWSPRQRKRLLFSWVASVAALFVNPFGARLVFYPLDLAFRQKLNIAHVAEWVSVDFHDLRGKIVLVLLFILLAAPLIRPRRWTLAELGLVLFGLYSGLTYIRFLFLLAILVTPTLAKTFEFVPRYRRELDTPIVNTFAIIAIIAGIAYFWPRESTLEAMVAEQYPVKAMSFLQTHPPDGPVLNFYLWGGYINWRDPEVKVFIDSRVDIFEYSGVLKDFLDLLALNEPKRLLDQYRIRYVLFPRKEPLTYALEHDPEWQVIYSDSVSVLLDRKTLPAEQVADRDSGSRHSTGGQI